MSHWYDLPYEERVRLMKPTVFHQIYGIIGTSILLVSKIVELLTFDKLRLWLGANQP